MPLTAEHEANGERTSAQVEPPESGEAVEDAGGTGGGRPAREAAWSRPREDGEGLRTERREVVRFQREMGHITLIAMPCNRHKAFWLHYVNVPIRSCGVQNNDRRGLALGPLPD